MRLYLFARYHSSFFNRIRFANYCSCTSVVTPFGIFNISTCFVSTRDILSTLVESEINAAAFHGAIITLQFLQLTLLSFTALTTSAAPPTNDLRMPSSGRTGRTPTRFAVGRIHLFFFFLVFKLINQSSLAFIAAQTAVVVARSLRVESFAFLRFLGEYIVSHVSARSLLCEYAMSCSRHAASNELIPWSPLASRFSNRVSGPQNWYLGICSSKGTMFITRFNKPLDDIRCNSSSKAPERRYAFDLVNCNASGTDGRTSESAHICSSNLSHNRSMQFSNFRSSIFGISVLLRLNCADHPTRWKTFWLLIDFALHNFINRPTRDIIFSILWKEKICGSSANRGRSKWRILTAKCKPIKRRSSMTTCYMHGTTCGPRLLLSLSDVRKDTEAPYTRQCKSVDLIQTGWYQSETRVQRSCEYRYVLRGFLRFISKC